MTAVEPDDHLGRTRQHRNRGRDEGYEDEAATVAEADPPERTTATAEAGRDQTRPTESSRWPKVWSRVGAGALILALPVMVYFGLRVTPFFVQNGIDPFIYVAYQQDPMDMFLRYGATYYFVRFGLILPTHWSVELFGILPGYFVLRWLLGVLAAAALWRLGRRIGSPLAGLLGALVCLCSPVFISAVMTVYADTVGVPCLVAGTALLLIPCRRGATVRALVAGLLFGLAVNANLFAIAPAIAAFGCRAVVQAVRREWRDLIDYVWVGIGVAIISGLGVLYYGLSFSVWNVFGPSISAAKGFSGQGALSFRSPTHAWMGFSPHIYVPALVGIGGLVLLLTRRRVDGESWWRRMVRPGLLDALVVLGGAQLLFVVHQFVFDAYSMETYFYYSYMFAFVPPVLTVIFADLQERPRMGTIGVAVCAAAVVAFPLIRDVTFGSSFELWALPWVPIFAAVVATAFGLARLLPRFNVVAGIVVVVTISLLVLNPPTNAPITAGQTFRFDPHYESKLGDEDPYGLEVYQASAELNDRLSDWDDDPGSTIYWYRNEAAVLNAVQATAIHRLASLQLLYAGLPTLNGYEVEALQNRTPRHLVILASNPEDIELGMDALSEVITPVATNKFDVGRGAGRVYVAVLTYTPSSCDLDWRSPIPWLTLPPCK